MRWHQLREWGRCREGANAFSTRALLKPAEVIKRNWREAQGSGSSKALRLGTAGRKSPPQLKPQVAGVQRPLYIWKKRLCVHLEISSRPQPRASGQGALEKLTLRWRLGFLRLQLSRTPRPRGVGTAPPGAARRVRAAARPWTRAKANPVGSSPQCWQGRTQH